MRAWRSCSPERRLGKTDAAVRTASTRLHCGKPGLNDWLLRHARQAQASGSAKTYVVTEDQHLVGYYSLAVGQIDTIEAPDRVRKGMGAYPIPVVILARLAVAIQDLRFGFEASPVREQQLLLLLKDARRLLMPAASGKRA